MVELLVGVGGDIIVVYVDAAFVRLVLDGLVYYLFLIFVLSDLLFSRLFFHFVF